MDDPFVRFVVQSVYMHAVLLGVLPQKEVKTILYWDFHLTISVDVVIHNTGLMILIQRL